MNFLAGLPEIFLALAAMAILTGSVVQKRDPVVLATMLSLGACLIAAVLVVDSDPGNAFGGLFITDGFSRFAKVLILAGTALSLVLSLDYNAKQGIGRFEFAVLILLSTVGMMVMASANNLMTLYMGLELQSLAIYVLAAFARDDVRSSEAGLKYFVLSALASGLLLYGISLTYGFSASMGFSDIAQAVTGPDVSTGLVVGLAFIITGLAFKLSAVPFHMWTPDVYEGAPTSVTAFMSTAPKVAAFVVLLRVMFGPFGHVVIAWQPIIILVSIASMFFGSIAAIAQSNIKRLMAYSSIANMGYALIGLAAGTQTGVRGVLVYLLTYVVMSAGAFACIAAMRRRGLAVEKIADLAGLAKNDFTLAALLAIFMFSMAGIPPMAGFFGKLMVFESAVNAGLWALAVIGVLTSVISCFFYLRVIKVMFFDNAAEAFDVRGAPLSFVALATGGFTLAFFAFPAPFLGAAGVAAKALFE